MADEIIELKTSDLYHKHKRNLLFYSTAAIVFSFAERTDGKFKVPGLDVELATRVAFALAVAAIIYAGFQYAAEYLAVRARNAHGWAEVEASRLDDALKAQAERLEHQTVRIDHHGSRMDDMLGGLRKELKRVAKETPTAFDTREEHSTIFGVPDPTIPDRLIELVQDELQMHRSVLLSEFESGIDRISSQVELVKNLAGEASGELKSIRQSNASLTTNFRRLSRSIAGSQRLGMVWLDGVVPGALAAVALVVSMLGALGTLPN